MYIYYVDNNGDKINYYRFSVPTDNALGNTILTKMPAATNKIFLRRHKMRN